MDGKSVLFDCLLADPPWRYDFSRSDSRKIENQYPTMTVEEICTLRVPALPVSVLYLWATVAKLPQALQVMEAWEFNYKSSAVWDKEILGMGYWFRGQHELLLVGTRGNFSPPDPSHRFSSVFRERRSKHSKKPLCIYEMLEVTYPQHKKIELFARNLRDGWASWGNEIFLNARAEI